MEEIERSSAGVGENLRVHSREVANIAYPAPALMRSITNIKNITGVA